MIQSVIFLWLLLCLISRRRVIIFSLTLVLFSFTQYWTTVIDLITSARALLSGWICASLRELRASFIHFQGTCLLSLPSLQLPSWKPKQTTLYYPWPWLIFWSDCFLFPCGSTLFWALTLWTLFISITTWATFCPVCLPSCIWLASAWSAVMPLWRLSNIGSLARVSNAFFNKIVYLGNTVVSCTCSIS